MDTSLSSVFSNHEFVYITMATVHIVRVRVTCKFHSVQVVFVQVVFLSIPYKVNYT